MLENYKITSVIMNTQDSSKNMSFLGKIDLYLRIQTRIYKAS